jgi:succinyl-CoA synthetase beta subunit
MARVKLSEWKAKKLLSESTGLSFDSHHLHVQDPLPQLDSGKEYVVKVDQGVKKRFKNGLVELNVKGENVADAVMRLSQKGFSRFIIEPHVNYPKNSEKYISLERVRDGVRVSYSLQGGVDIEAHPESVTHTIVKDRKSLGLVAQELCVTEKVIKGLFDAFDTHHFSFLEINPFVAVNDLVHLLDAACEVDSCAEFFVKGAWSDTDIVDGSKSDMSEEEKNVKQLAAQSTAAFSLKVLNPEASIFLLLNSGGSSIVIADEVFERGFGTQIGNFGENSGSPSTEESHIYSKNVISLLLKSPLKKKVLIIGGGVANFTDVRTTFRGVIQALDEFSEDLRLHEVKVFVRRGGPNQAEGLKMMKDFLEKEQLYGAVHGPDVVLTDVVGEAVTYL